MKTIIRNIVQGRVFQGALVSVLAVGLSRYFHVLPEDAQHYADALVPIIVAFVVQQFTTPTSAPVLEAGAKVTTTTGNPAKVVTQ